MKLIWRRERFKYIEDNYREYCYNLSKWRLRKYVSLGLHEDNVQITGMKLWEDIDIIDMDQNVEGLVTTATIHNAIDLYRSNKKHVDYTPIEKVESLLFSPEALEELLITRLELRGMWDVIESLDDKYKEICKLRFLHELSIDEISRKTNIKANTIKTRLKKAKKDIRKQAKERGWY